MDNTQELKDEIEKGLKDQAWVYAALYKGLLEEGVSDRAAGEITAAWGASTKSSLTLQTVVQEALRKRGEDYRA